jgi:hypothetical protein
MMTLAGTTIRNCESYGDHDSGTWMGNLRGNATETGHYGGIIKKSFFLFVMVRHPEIGLSGISG